MGRPHILARGNQIVDPDRDQTSQRNLERHRGDIDVVVTGSGGMQVDAVVSHADAVRKSLGCREADALPGLFPHMMLMNGRPCADAS